MEVLMGRVVWFGPGISLAGSKLIFSLIVVVGAAVGAAAIAGYQYAKSQNDNA